MAITERYVSSTGVDTYANSTNPLTPMSWATMVANAAAGDRINVKSDGTYSRTTTTDALANNGTTTSPIIIRGYNSVIGDGYLGRTNGNGNLITTNMPLISYTTGRFNTTGTFVILESLNFSGNPSNPLVAVPSDSAARSCKAVNASTNAAAVAFSVGSRSILFDSDAELSGGSGGGSAVSCGSAAGCRIFANRIKGGPATGITGGTATPFICGNTIFESAGPNIAVTNTAGALVVVFNTVVSGTGDGIDVVANSTVSHFIAGNMITDNGGIGVDMNTAAGAAFLAYDRTRDNVGGATNLGTDWIGATSYGNVTTDTGGPSTDYVDSASDDFRLIAASPATSAGLPEEASIGALQRDQTEAASGASSYTFG